ncbi:Lipopolysaccharide core heptosyltransferase rfaQ [Serratia quinivorans]|uniref:putative lipopolysaccharide heptosyltransferase III n=1 Tax=Serratia quinivorans TaxID=137545 RepID=UPI0021794E89|nr:putative lipopolysaccharide heptosyltransferase III [Serratia quinivorans]CAI1242573.1 Lipopolysaccharide core heptosyltransferase rfaQ [Serratia quinivorans]CAI2024907.1 Lipopolysaccharide core heptosyltransferase rfaQ [Serratia quinivorans]CAI2160633.1 Lipopolysaccharide core heptosyltransferase rfaQ [Serratia quinivorans]CAI2539566.1 Lipopolysaccharide core heptosyltransferase rfaQ [Serratia quinivorans]CAI2539609.1 Lipopolysaccharide core heptosyltransferase rfaQ [Serratia quinivorans]
MTNAPYNTRNTPSQATLSDDRQVPNALLRRETVQRILVIKLRHFGDVLLMTPLLSTLRANYPNALIDVLVYEGTEAMLAGNQDVYLAYTVDRNLKHQRLKAQYRGEQALWNSLRTGHYDLVINLSDQWRAALYCRFLKPTFSLGFRYPKRNNRLWQACYSLLVDVADTSKHTVLNNLDILVPLALPTIITTVTQTWRQRDVDEIDRLSRRHHLTDFVLIQPTARWAFKTWTVEGFSAVINHLTAQGRTVVITGGRSPDEAAMISAIMAGCLSPQRVVNLAGRLDLPELAVLIDRARLFIGVDSVPMHMAAALKTPSVVLFGPSNRAQWAPWQAPHTLLWAGDYCSLPPPGAVDTDTPERYLAAIPVNDVIRAVSRQLTLSAAPVVTSTFR